MKFNFLILVLSLISIFSCKKDPAEILPIDPSEISVKKIARSWNWVGTSPNEDVLDTFFASSFCPGVFLENTGKYARICNMEEPVVSELTFHDTDLWEIQNSQFIISDFSGKFEMEIIELTEDLLILVQEVNQVTYTHRLEAL